MGTPARLSNIQASKAPVSRQIKSPLPIETLIGRLLVVALCVTSALLISVAISIKPMRCNPIDGQHRARGQQQQQVANRQASQSDRPAYQRRQRRHHQQRQQEDLQKNPSIIINTNNGRDMQLKRPTMAQSLAVGVPVPLKRFKSAFNVVPMARSVGHLASAASEPSTARNSFNGAQTSVIVGNAMAHRATASIGDINNNNSLSAQSPFNDVNNNTIHSATSPEMRRNVNSVNGTIDLSLYEQSDVDILYGDALLVYLKNFNETLPARREIVSINGSQSHVPVYRSETSSRPKRMTG